MQKATRGCRGRFQSSRSITCPVKRNIILSAWFLTKLSGPPEFAIWGSGTPRRDFLQVDDAADALVQLMIHYFDEKPVTGWLRWTVTHAWVSVTFDNSVARLFDFVAVFQCRWCRS